ncbi:acetyl-CoA C-acetyltransferase [Acinetobacter portensis]|uniref:Acetyl-CoA C-acetyltransferase n=2 Tax=Acinetobacter TaxID=469 RepID=A0A6L6GHC7_9GAMM|nr:MULTISPECIES: acetyl-CoA C-acetyltransferase [Acinetobacter]MCK7609624.1 acetyl-CoA C-acetyltransferase [Acinetobacter portensis]MCK7640392.1 acetyl-CoA C-acetyltransferase [Acinetobacter portensis]MDY6462335.1 acetyl-CoA C-acetyltransferase [Acinetobacter faecalis]MDY6485314.1 acetyl-CoA C-acetyltransferase [Acinetobacter faecalis]MDY6487896.1 acetyl-CoA C-acetyltransferase [Acinetobacter faecalis]
MSKITQENPAVDNSVVKPVSNTSKSTTRAKSTGTAAKATNTTTKTTTTRTPSTRRASTATSTKTAATKTVKPKTQPKIQQGQSMSQNTVRRVAIIGGNRIPFARSNGAYFSASNSDMFTAALNGLVERFNLQGQRLGEVVAGAVLKHSRDFNMTRECVLNTALAPETPAFDLQQACGTGLQAAFLVANKIALGQIEVGVAGGVDTTSDAPIAFGDGLRKALLELNIAKTAKDRFKALAKINIKDLMDAPKNGEPRTGLSMGDHQALTTLEWGISREAQDELAASSHQKMAAAYEEGFFDDLITPFLGLERDNNLRADSTVEKLAKLRPAFGKGDARTMTAGNSTPLTDGASCVLLASEEWAKANGHEVLAYLTFTETAAVDFVNKKEGLLMAPAYAVPRMLERAGLKLQDFDYYEIHEAFASQVLSTLKAWEDPKFCKDRLGLEAPLGSIDRSKLNVKGSSLAAGHPFAATGGRIIATAAKLINQKGSGRVLVSICAAGGQGVTAIIEK